MLPRLAHESLVTRGRRGRLSLVPMSRESALDPFIDNSVGEVFLSFQSVGSTPKGAFTASLNQLRHLIRVFNCRYASASYGIFWHTILLQVANATLTNPSDPNSLLCFLFYISCYKDLFPSYRVVLGIVKGLLSIAWQRHPRQRESPLCPGPVLQGRPIPLQA